MNPPVRSKKFSFNGRSLEVRAGCLPENWGVRVFENDKPITEITYTVSHMTAIDALPIQLVEQLMDLAQKDVEKGIVVLLPARK